MFQRNQKLFSTSVLCLVNVNHFEVVYKEEKVEQAEMSLDELVSTLSAFSIWNSHSR